MLNWPILGDIRNLNQNLKEKKKKIKHSSETTLKT
jgi:hypothetical protein